MILMVLFFCLTATVYAQTRIVRGTVSDSENGAKLLGVTVKVKGNKAGALTNEKGEFVIELPSGFNILELTYLGYAKNSTDVTNKSFVQVSLTSDAKNLTEVVVTAYGTTKRRDFVGASAQIGSKEIAERPVANVINALQGAASGVTLAGGTGQPGSAPAIRVRGFGSINSSNSPLYVVDGAPYDYSINNLNQDDIETITVAKDASSTALYGSRAANGVVFITTKKGKVGAPAVNVKYTTGLTARGIQEYDRVDVYEYYPLVWESIRNGAYFGGTKTYTQAGIDAAASLVPALGYNAFNVANNVLVSGVDGKLNPNASLLYGDDLDWWTGLMKTGVRQEVTTSINGVSEKSDYLFSAGYLNEKGALVNTGFKRYSARLNVNNKPTSFLTTGVNLAYTFADYQNNGSADDAGSAYANPFNFVTGMGPIYPVYAHNPATGAYVLDPITGDKVYDSGALGTKYGITFPTRGAGGSSGRHVLAETLYNISDQERHLISGRTYGQVDFLKDFNFRVNLAYDHNTREAYSYQNAIIGDAAPSGGQTKTAYNATTLTLTQLLGYKKTIAKRHEFAALLGHENYYSNDRVLSGNKTGLIADGINELDNFTTIGGLTSYQDNYRMESYFGEVKYNLDQKYYLTATLRRDGSSKFKSDVRWGNFWSLGGAWLVNEESFMKNVGWVDQLKLRASYGETGSDGTSYYGYQSLYNLKPNVSNPAYYLAAAANPELSWETNKTADIALEFGLFKNRVRGSIEAFRRASSNLIFNVPLPSNAGTTSITKNIGTMVNKGIEFDLTFTPVKSKDFTWDLTVNGSFYKNEITKMPSETPTIVSGTKQYKVGNSIYEFWLRQWVGVDPQTGSSIYLSDLSTPGNTLYTTQVNQARYEYSGSAIPDLAGGIKNLFAYKGVSLSSIFSYSLGGKFYDGNYNSLMVVNDRFGKSFHKDVLKRWQNPGDVTNVPRVDDTQSTNLSAGTSTRWLIDNNFLVLRNVTLGYAIPTKYVSKLKLSRINVFASGDNLVYLTPRKGLDPTTSFNGTNSSSYVPSRIFSFGANVSF